jgi:hypothetical protein
MWVDQLPSVHSACGIPIRSMTWHSPFGLMFGQDVVLLKELENVTWSTANWMQGIDNAAPWIADRARQLEQR